jgi:hypothetical protein
MPDNIHPVIVTYLFGFQIYELLATDITTLNVRSQSYTETKVLNYNINSFIVTYFTILVFNYFDLWSRVTGNM